MDGISLNKDKLIWVQGKRQKISGINDDDMMTEMVRKFTVAKKTNEVTSKQLLV